MDDDAAATMWEKAAESLAGAEREFAAGGYNNCANRCYYACFQAAIVALMRAGIRPQGRTGQWSHEFVQAQFAGQLVNQRKAYPARLRGVLNDNLAVRRTADYTVARITATQASRALARTRDFLAAVEAQGGTL